MVYFFEKLLKKILKKLLNDSKLFCYYSKILKSLSYKNITIEKKILKKK